MSRLVAALGLLLAGTVHAAEPDAMLQLSTGLRPLGLPLGTALGGGLRAGIVAGPVTPFLGGSASWARGRTIWDGASVDETGYGLGTGWTAQLGARVRLGDLEFAETWLVAGTLLATYGGKSIWDPQEGRGDGLFFKAGPGGFLGGGADAFVAERLSLTVEGGLSYVAGGWSSRYYTGAGSTDSDDYKGANLAFVYSSLGLTVWLGGGE